MVSPIHPSMAALCRRLAVYFGVFQQASNDGRDNRRHSALFVERWHVGLCVFV